MENAYVLYSFLIFLVTTAFSLYLLYNPGYRTKIKPIYLITAGVILSTLFIMLEADCKSGTYGDGGNFFIALFHTIQVMLAGYEIDRLFYSLDVSKITHIYFGILFVSAPICTFGFVLSFFESATSYFRCLFAYKKDMYILSDISEKSLVLAKSIRTKFPRCAIVFAETETRLKEHAKDCNGIIIKTDIEKIKPGMHSKNAKLVFFAIEENESKNQEVAISIINNFKNRKNTELYVFASSTESELLFDSMDKGCMKVRRINEDRAFAYSIIHNTDYMITKDITEKEGKKIISALIVGFDGYGTEMAKALLWCGQLPDYELEINVIDKNPHAEANFEAQCPEIMKLNHNTTFGEARYSISFYSGVEINSIEFNNVVSSLSNTSVVYVSLGNDEFNIETAINLRTLLERCGLFPKIRAVVRNELKYNTLQKYGLSNYKNENYQIEVIGCLKDRYSYDTIIDEDLETLALKYHLQWANTKDKIAKSTKQFNETEYFRRSSAATAIHEIYRKNEGISSDMDSIVEHMRWNAYMRTEGYIYSGSPDEATRNDRAKKHHLLVPAELLNDEEKAKDTRIIEMKL